MSLFADPKEDLRIKMKDLEQKLADSEEERCRLEKTCNVLMRAFREEERMQYKALNNKYEKFLQDCSVRKRRNDLIMRTLCRIEDRSRALFAKTERLKLLKDRYTSYLKIKDAYRGGNPYILKSWPVPTRDETSEYETISKSVQWRTPLTTEKFSPETQIPAYDVEKSSPRFFQYTFPDTIYDPMDFSKEKVVPDLTEPSQRESVYSTIYGVRKKPSVSEVSRTSFSKVSRPEMVHKEDISSPIINAQETLGLLSDKTYGLELQNIGTYCTNGMRSNNLKNYRSVPESTQKREFLENNGVLQNKFNSSKASYYESHTLPVDIVENQPDKSQQRTYNFSNSCNSMYIGRSPSSSESFGRYGLKNGTTMEDRSNYEGKTLSSQQETTVKALHSEGNVAPQNNFNSLHSNETKTSATLDSVRVDGDKKIPEAYNIPKSYDRVQNERSHSPTEYFERQEPVENSSKIETGPIFKNENLGAQQEPPLQHLGSEGRIVPQNISKTSNECDKSPSLFEPSNIHKIDDIMPETNNTPKGYNHMYKEESSSSSEVFDRKEPEENNTNINYKVNFNNENFSSQQGTPIKSLIAQNKSYVSDFIAHEKNHSAEQQSLKNSNNLISKLPGDSFEATDVTKATELKEKGIITHQESIEQLKRALSLDPDSSIKNGQVEKTKEKYDIEISEKGQNNSAFRTEIFNSPSPTKTSNEGEVISQNDTTAESEDKPLPMGLDGVDYQNETYPESYYEQPVHHHNHTNIAVDVILEEDETEQEEGDNFAKTEQTFQNNNEESASWQQSPRNINEPDKNGEGPLNNEESEKLNSEKESEIKQTDSDLESRSSNKGDPLVGKNEKTKVSVRSNLMHLLESDSESFQIEHGDAVSGNEDSDFDFSFH